VASGTDLTSNNGTTRLPPPGPKRWLGLRATVTVLFSVGALLLSVVFSVGTYLVVRKSLVDQRTSTVTRQALADASAVRDGLRTQGAPVSDVLGTLAPAANTTIFIRLNGEWFSTSLKLTDAAIPSTLQSAITDGRVHRQWTTAAGDPAIVIGLTLPDVQAEYYAISAAPDLENTLALLRLVLGSFAILTALGGGAIGQIAGRRLLTPLRHIGQAATKISAGDLSIRLPLTKDRDLSALVSSFNSMVQALEVRIARDNRFAADLSHELRSPLTTLMTGVDLLNRRRDDLPTRSQQALDLVRTELARFHQALEDLLELGQLDAGIGLRDPTVIPALELVQEAIEASGRSVSRLLAPNQTATEVAWVLADKQQLSRALRNLFDNADRHAGGVTSVSVQTIFKNVHIEVADEGPGIALAERLRVFERFYRVGSRGSRTGAGLGLSLVAEIATAHQGYIWCAERSGGGCVFILQLPTVAAPEVHS
jgi:two-component system, OmpR family, sensor histidine kinase MtrB